MNANFQMQTKGKIVKLLKNKKPAAILVCTYSNFTMGTGVWGGQDRSRKERGGEEVGRVEDSTGETCNDGGENITRGDRREQLKKG